MKTHYCVSYRLKGRSEQLTKKFDMMTTRELWMAECALAIEVVSTWVE